MKKKVIWGVVSGWMVAALLLVSCAPAAVEQEKKVAPQAPKEVPKEVVVPKKVVAPKPEKEGPQYGGVLTLSRNSDVNAGFKFSQTLVGTMSYGNWWHLRGLILETMLVYDPAKGPRGSKLWGFEPQPDVNPLVMKGNLIESWDIDAEKEIIKVKAREGIYWQDGTEFTAEDILYTFHLLYGGLHMPPGWQKNRPYIKNIKNPQESIYLDPEDPTGRTVVFESAPGLVGNLWTLLFAYWGMIYPRSLGDRDGFGSYKDVFGTGPYVIKDYVRNSSMTYERAPNPYWKSDPLHPENQLPYPDGVRWLVIPDISTRLAALRTGKIDIMGFSPGVSLEDAQTLWKFNPELQYRVQPPGSGPALALRNDTAPFNDIRVRRALMMAIDHDELVEDLYGGHATKFYWPTFPGQPNNIYVPIDNMPQEVKELYEYHPDRAKQLLTEAGYPDGFSVTVQASAANRVGIDAALILKEYFKKVNVEFNLAIKEPGAWASMRRAQTYKQGLLTTVSGYHTYNWFNTKPHHVIGNSGLVDDPAANRWMEIQSANLISDPEEWVRMWPEITAEQQTHAFYIQTPLPDTFMFWQPWVKNYFGEMYPDPGPASIQEIANTGVWIDQELKASMGK